MRFFRHYSHLFVLVASTLLTELAHSTEVVWHISAKFILDSRDEFPDTTCAFSEGGQCLLPENLQGIISQANTLLRNNAADVTLELTETVLLADVSQWFDRSPCTDNRSLAASATTTSAGRTRYQYRDNQINLYINAWDGPIDGIDGSCGLDSPYRCYSPGLSSTDKLVFIGRRANPATLLHQIGHFLGLSHTGGDRWCPGCASAAPGPDPRLLDELSSLCEVYYVNFPECGNDEIRDTLIDCHCGTYCDIAEANFGPSMCTNLTEQQRESIDAVVHNVMAFHFERTRLTEQQIQRMTRIYAENVEPTPVTGGTLQIMLAPQGAINAGAEWTIEELLPNWFPSGHQLKGIAPGPHTLLYKSIPGWVAPTTPGAVTFMEDESIALQAIYLASIDAGGLQVFISPQEAIAAGAGWRISDNSPWLPSGHLEIGIPAGIRTITFKPLIGWREPEPLEVSVAAGVNLSLIDAATYSAATTGSLQILLNPSDARTAGAAWSLSDNSMWHPSGYLLSDIPPGLYTLHYKQLLDWAAPVSINVRILAGQAISLTADYQTLSLVRGDTTSDRRIDISDAIRILSVLFSGDAAFACKDAADANDDDNVDISDALSILMFLFFDGDPPVATPPDCNAAFAGESYLSVPNYQSLGVGPQTNLNSKLAQSIQPQRAGYITSVTLVMSPNSSPAVPRVMQFEVWDDLDGLPNNQLHAQPITLNVLSEGAFTYSTNIHVAANQRIWFGLAFSSGNTTFQPSVSTANLFYNSNQALVRFANTGGWLPFADFKTWHSAYTFNSDD